MRIDTALSEFVRQSVAAPPPVADGQEPDALDSAEADGRDGEDQEDADPASL
jgi:hypothetical protein